MSIIRTVLLAFAGVAVLVGAFTIFNSLSITVAQRTKEFGLLRMVGATRRQVRFGVLLEALLVGLLASAAGIGVGVGAGRRPERALHRARHGPAGRGPRAGDAHDRRLAARRHAGDDARGRDPRPPGDADRARSPRCARAPTPSRSASSPARVRGVASVVGRPAARLGGAAGRLARDNAMRNPGRTAVTASALMIGVALVTAVTIVAQGLEDQGRGQLADQVQAQTIVTAADGWSPIDPKIEQAVARLGHVSSMRQDGALAFGTQQGVNAIDPADPAFRFDVIAGDTRLGRDGALVNDGLRVQARPQRRLDLRRHVDRAASSCS